MRKANKRLPPRGRDALRKYAGGIVGTGVLDGPISGEQACLANWAEKQLPSLPSLYATPSVFAYGKSTFPDKGRQEYGAYLKY